MVTKSSNPDEQNQDAYDDLIVSIEAGEGKLSLLIAVCDNGTFREEIITKYETELQPNFRNYRITLAREEPSLNAAINKLIEQEEYLRNSQPAVITVTGVQQLFFLRFGEEQSEQEKFFGYLQWTREALREYPFAIVLWVTNQLLVNLIKQAPDFWSWRSGVFHFVSKAKNFVDVRELEPIRLTFQGTELDDFDDDKSYSLSVEDLQRLIEEIERESGKEDKKLATLYLDLALIYGIRLDRGEAGDYQKEQDLAITYYSKAVELQTKLGLEDELVHSLNNLARLYYSQERYGEAEPLYIQALELRKRILGENHPDTATNLNNLASLYYSQRRYDEAEVLYIQALELRKSIFGENHRDTASSLNNLGLLYDSQGRYDEAEVLYIQALELRKRILGENHTDTASSLSSLAGLYDSQGRYDEAELLYIQALELIKRILGENHPDIATSLNNLAGLYKSQGGYDEAEPLYIQALEICKQVLAENHPTSKTVRKNLESMQRERNKKKPWWKIIFGK